MSNETTVAGHDNIFDALAAAQGEFTEILKEKTAKIRMKSGGEYSYKYADLAAVIEATRPHLSRHGLSVSWIYVPGERMGHGKYICRLQHHSGLIESSVPVFYDAEAQSVMQSMGSAMTYARRYSYSGLIGVVAEDDDDGAGAGTPPKQDRRQREPEQRPRERSATPPAGDAKPASPPAQIGEKKPLIEQIKDKILAASDREAIVNIMQKSAVKWPDKEPLLTDIFNICAEENRNRAANGYTYDDKVWNEEDRKWVFAELTKIMDSLGKPAEQTAEPESAGPVDWPARIAAVTQSDKLFALISEAADDSELTANLNHFNGVCGLITAKLDAHTNEWGEGVVNISRHHLAQRITAVELDRQHKEAQKNAQAS